MIVGGYSLHVYCEVCNAFAQNEHNERNRTEATAALSKRGWLIAHGINKALCPEHAPKSAAKK